MRFDVIYVSDEDLLASYADNVYGSTWKFHDLAAFQEWLQYAVMSDQVSGMIHAPSGSMWSLSLGRVKEDSHDD